ncbi:MAG: hypothetical protein JST93_11295 [Acidobacteria bacterium]|nr:hypothetical protein [Acidobacteriota bacterium]
MRLLLFLFAAVQTQPSLEQGFRNPPLSARPSFYFLLLNGYLNREYLPVELKQYRDAGFGSLTLFDMGARGDKAAQPPAGPEFLSAQSAADIAHVIRTAGGLGMDVDLSVSSSWDMGASWVKPEEASMTLLSAHVDVEGSRTVDMPLPLPALPAETPRLADGQPQFRKEIATLAIRDARPLEGYTFIIQLEPPYPRQIHRVVLFNTNAPGCTVSVSTTTPDSEAFRTILNTKLERKEGAQSFAVAATPAKYIKLTLQNAASGSTALGEFQAWTTEERNVALSHKVNRLVDGADIVRQPSSLGQLGDWAASNIHDNVLDGPRGSWMSGPAPLRVDQMEQIQDISRHVDAQGRLRWTAPAGRWRVIRYLAVNTGEKLKVPSPNSDGLATDHFSEPATVRYINEVIRRLQPAVGDLRKSALKELYLASYEVRGQVWTPSFLEEFRKRRQYDLTPYLPALTGSQIKDESTTERVLYDYRKTQGELLVDNYYRAAVRTAGQAGLGVESEAGGPGPPIHQVPVDALLANSAVTTVRGEFWPYRQNAAAMWVVKETAAAAHIYGKPIVAMEAFTSSYHWYEGPQDLKASADRAFAEGMNHVVWHTASHHPPEAGKPGWVYYAGTHLTPNVVWWPFARPFLDYLARASFLLRQGLPVSDVLHYYGDQGYNFVPPKHVDAGTGYGYDYDVTNADALVRRLSVQKGRLTLPEGTQYAVLALPDREDIDLEVLRKLATLAEQGATIVGPKPKRATGYSGYPGKDAQVRELADLLWGRGLIKNRAVREAMGSLGVGPDLRFSGDESAIDFVHRRTANEDIYFVRNKTKEWVEGDATFRVSGRRPEIWDAVTGNIEARAGNPVHLRLAPDGSTFVVFRDGAGKAAPPGARRESSAITLDGPWEVRFAPNLGAPAQAVFPKLISWTEHMDDGIRYYSGIAEYRKQFVVKERAGRVTLDLGEMWAMAEVTVNNGKPQVVWQRPFEADITADVKVGVNELRVRVANNWVNRLVGDARNAGPKIAKTNVTTNSPAGIPWAKVEPRASGLLGPVRVLSK